MKDTNRVLIALGLGLLAGAVAAASGNPTLLRLAEAVAPVGTLWVNAIRMTVIPLVVSLVISGVASAADLRAIGRIERLPSSVQAWVRKAVSETAGNAGMVLNLALSYGGRSEILEAIRRLRSANGAAGELTEEVFSASLDTAGLPDPDLIIRTSGEKRISNFLLWQSAYAELYFTDTLWPDFEEQDLLAAILDYQGRQRRFGLTQEQLVRK